MKKLLLIICFFTVIVFSFSQTMKINFLDETIAEYSISEIQKVQFESGFMSVYFFNESSLSFDITTINYYQHVDGGLGVETQKPLSVLPNINIFPNPTHDKINLEFELLRSGKYYVRITDNSGKQVFIQEYHTDEAGLKKLNIATENFAAGIHLISIEIGSQRATKNVMLN